MNKNKPRCRHCKERFNKTDLSNPYCSKSECQQIHRDIVNEKERKRIDKQTKKAIANLNKIKKDKKKAAKEKLKTKSDYEKELEKVFNEFIRLRDKDQPCISCDAPAGKYRITAGHYFPQGSNKNIRFDEDNVHGQCWYNCNKNQHGNLSEYLPRLIDKIGQERYEQLLERRRTPAHFSIPELKEMKEIYKQKVKELKSNIQKK